MILSPAVWIYKARSLSTESFQPILWGLEEEGIPFKINDMDDGPMEGIAKQAADSSPLRVGIGVGGTGEIVLHHHDLPTESPLFRLPTKSWHDAALRRIGSNAARLVKGQPLIFDGDETRPAGVEVSERNPHGETEELIRQILSAVLKEYAA